MGGLAGVLGALVHAGELVTVASEENRHLSGAALVVGELAAQGGEAFVAGALAGCDRVGDVVGVGGCQGADHEVERAEDDREEVVCLGGGVDAGG